MGMKANSVIILFMIGAGNKITLTDLIPVA